METNEQTKQCRICKEIKSANDFYDSASHLDLKQTICIECFREIRKKHYQFKKQLIDAKKKMMEERKQRDKKEEYGQEN